MDRSASPLALLRSTESNAFKGTTNRASPCGVLGNVACDTTFRGGPGHGLEVGNEYLTFTATGALPLEMLTACVPVAYVTLQVR